MNAVESKHFDRVDFHFLGNKEDVILPGTVLFNGRRMVLEIAGGDGPYHLVGKSQRHAFAAANDHPDRRAEVQAQWCNVGNCYVGIWVEEGNEYLFSFELR